MIAIAYIEADQASQFTFEQIAVLLRANGIDNDLQCYASTQDALDQIPSERPHIVFLDLRAANGTQPDGLALARQLHRHPLCRQTILVGMAEYAMPADRDAAIAAGCDDFLPKPARYQAVEDIILQHVYDQVS